MPWLIDLAPRRAAMAVLAGLMLAACSSRDLPPSFTYTALDGTRSSSQALRGQVVLVNFWATSCTSCVKEMPLMAATHRKYQGRGLQTLAVAMNYDPPAAVSEFAQRRQLPFAVVIDNTGAIARAFADLRATPTTYLLDKRGTIVKRFVGEPDFTELHALVEKLMAEA
jgi:peroxiredoxin